MIQAMTITENEPLIDETDGITIGIPANLVYALRRYARNHEPLGGFLTAVLANDFTEAVCRADMDSIRAIRQIAIYVVNAMPSKCHGSREAVKAWLKMGRDPL